MAEKIFKNRREKATRPVAVKLNQVQDALGANRRRMMAVIAVPVVALVLLGSAYLVLVDSRTKTLETELKENVTKVNRTIGTFAKKYAKTPEKDRPKAIQQLATSLPSVDCGVHFLYGPLVKAIKRCDAQNKAVAALKNQLNQNSTVVAYNTQVLAALKKAQAVDNDTKTDWTKKEAAWHAAKTEIERIVPPSEFLKAHKALTKQLQALVSAWQTLQKADKAKSLKEYEDAKKNLAAKYDQLRESAEGFETTFDQVQAKTRQAANAIMR